MKTLIESIASSVAAYHNCVKSNNTDWQNKHVETIASLEKMLPSGSGIDNGTKIDIDRSSADKVVLIVGFHHMNENGYYDGWTEHDIIVTPAFIGGVNLRITGRDRNQIKDHLYDTYAYALCQPAERSAEKSEDRRVVAAPELLKACKAIVEHVESLPNDTEKCRILRLALNNRAGDLIRAAIAKAEGSVERS